LLGFHLVRCILHHYTITASKVQVYCLTKQLMRLLQGLQYRSVASALLDNSDLLTEISFIQRALKPRSVITYTYLNLEHKESPPAAVYHIDRLGHDISEYKDNRQSSIPQTEYISPPNNTVTTYYKGKPLVEKIKETIRRDTYLPTIQATICKQEDWSEEAFLSIDWAAHEYAFSRTWSCKRISYTKLTHKLLNTNVQNRKYYGKSDLCPCCVSTAETLAHVFICPSPDTTVFRLNQQEVLWNQLTLINTPEEVQTAIQSGIKTLEGTIDTQIFTSKTVTSAFADQSILGWEPFLRGRISHQWQAAFDGEEAPVNTKDSYKWAGQLVTLLLNYAQQLWIFRCGVVHGHTTTDHRQRHREELQYNIRAAYEEYGKDPFCILSEWRTLFNRPVEMLLISDRDTLRSWLRSYTEARQQQALINSRHTLSIKDFFSPAPKAHLDSGNLNTDASRSGSSSDKDISFCDTDDDDASVSSQILTYCPFGKRVSSNCTEDLIEIEELDTG
jgi:hypothetical protein